MLPESWGACVHVCMCACAIDIPLMAEHATDTYLLHLSGVGLSINHHLLQKETSLELEKQLSA